MVRQKCSGIRRSYLGEEIPRDFKNIPSHVLKKAVCCVENYCINLEKAEEE
nr:hypothetical protein [uncultured bacterium]